MAVINPIKLIIINIKENYNEYLYAYNIPNNKLSNKRKIYFNKYLYIEYNDINKIINNYNIDDIIIKLKYSYIIKIVYIEYKNNIINNIFCIYFPNTLNTLYLNNKKANFIIHWVSCNNNIFSKFNIYNNLFNDNKNLNILENINKNSIYSKYGYTENFNINVKNKIFQLERIGYFNFKKILIKIWYFLI